MRQKRGLNETAPYRGAVSFNQHQRQHAKAARERLTLIRVYEELCGLGYRGSYDAVRR
jgi:hypothetical protein